MSLSNLKISGEKVVLSGAAQPDRSSSSRYSSVSIVGGFLYIVGNLFTTKSPRSVVGVLNIRECKWRWIPYAHTYYISPRIFLYEDSLFMFRTKELVGVNTRRMSRFDLVSEQWAEFDTVTTGAGPKRLTYFSGEFLEKGKLFVVFGGQTSGKHRNDVHVLNVPEKIWVQPKIKGKQPESRYLHGSCTYQGKIYYFGGWTRGRRCNDGLHVLALTNGNTVTWSTLKQIDLELSSFALVSIGRLLVFCGGSSSGSRTVLRVYDPVAGKLMEVPLERALAKHLGYGLVAFQTPFANTIGLIGGNARVDSYVQLTVSP